MKEKNSGIEQELNLEKKVGSFPKLQFFVIVKINDQQYLPVRYSAANHSLNLLSALRVIDDKRRKTSAFEAFIKKPQLGISEIEKRYIKKPFDKEKLQKFYEKKIPNFEEKHGKVKGTRQDLHYRGYTSSQDFKADDFSEEVMFLSLEELQKKIDIAQKQNHNINEIEIRIGEKTYRINRGITDALEEYEQFNRNRK
jgi:hypothetical protein